MARLRQGDRGALESLYMRYFDRLYSLVFHQVDRNSSATEDIVQETFLAVLKSRRRFRGESKFYTWLCGIAYHKIHDFYRQQSKQNRHGQVISSLNYSDLCQVVENEPSTQSQVESHETEQIMEQALSKLPLNYRQALIFKYVEEMPVSQISLIIGLSPKSVEGILTRARKALRNFYDKASEG